MATVRHSFFSVVVLLVVFLVFALFDVQVVGCWQKNSKSQENKDFFFFSFSVVSGMASRKSVFFHGGQL